MDDFEKYAYRYLFVVVVLTLCIGTIVYHYVEKLSWLNAYYFSVVTLATVGYGDIVPTTNFGKIFTTFYIFVGVGVVTTFFSVTMRRRWERVSQRKNEKRDS